MCLHACRHTHKHTQVYIPRKALRAPLRQDTAPLIFITVVLLSHSQYIRVHVLPCRAPMRQSTVQLLIIIVISLLVYQCTCTTLQSSFETRLCTTTTYYYCLVISFWYISVYVLPCRAPLRQGTVQLLLIIIVLSSHSGILVYMYYRAELLWDKALYNYYLLLLSCHLTLVY